MKTNLKWLGNMALVAKGESKHWVPMDADSKVGGEEAGTRPMEMILMGLGGCTSMDVISILKKMRVPLEDYEMEIKAERAENHPKVFTKIELKFIFYGKGIKEKQVARAIELSEETYCSASAMLKKTAEIKTTFEIREPKIRY